MENPFRFGNATRGEYFTDREQELEALETDLASGQNVVIISPRRFGKTSLLLLALRRARATGALTAYLDLFECPTKEVLVKKLAGALFQSLEAPPRKAMAVIQDHFKGLTIRPVLSVGPDGTPKLELTPAARAHDLDADLERLLALPQEIAARRKKRVILAIDEFQEVADIDPDLPRIMRSIFQHQQDVAHVYLGSKFHLMTRIFYERNQPFYKSAKKLPLGPIGHVAFGRFIADRFGATGKSIGQKVIDRILDITEGHPGDTQELCYFTWSVAHALGTDPTDDVVDQALKQVLVTDSARYLVVCDSLTPNQRMVLTALASEPSKALGEDYRQRHLLGSAANVQKARIRLRDLELVELRSDGNYHVPDVFFRRWLRDLAGR